MKNVLITGGSRGLGKELINIYYANNYNVFSVVRKQEDADNLSKVFTDNFTPIVTDLTDDKCIDIIENTLSKSIKHLDVLINNAGIPGNAYKIEDVTSTEMNSLFEVHITSRLGSLSSMVSGEFENLEVSYSYRIAKASQNMLSICLKQELEPYNIEVISIHPGRIQTQSGSSDANSSAYESAEKIFIWIKDDNINKECTFTEPYERDWNW